MNTDNWLIEYDKITQNVLEDNLLKKDTLTELKKIKTELLNISKVSKFKIEIEEKDVVNILINICWISLSHFLYEKLQDYDKTILICRNIFKKKNEDYGNAFLDYNVIGIIVRMCDKINRINNLISKDIDIKVIDENIDDTYLDLFNYAVLAQCLIKM